MTEIIKQLPPQALVVVAIIAVSYTAGNAFLKKLERLWYLTTIAAGVVGAMLGTVAVMVLPIEWVTPITSYGKGAFIGFVFGALSTWIYETCKNLYEAYKEHKNRRL